MEPLRGCLGGTTHLITGRALHDHSGPDSKRGHGQHRENHPLGPGELGVHAQDDVLLVGDALEDLVHTLRVEQDLLLLRVLIHVLPLGVQLQACPTDDGLVTPTASMTLEGQRSNGVSGFQTLCRVRCGDYTSEA